MNTKINSVSAFYKQDHDFGIGVTLRLNLTPEQSAEFDKSLFCSLEHFNKNVKPKSKAKQTAFIKDRYNQIRDCIRFIKSTQEVDYTSFWCLCDCITFLINIGELKDDNFNGLLFEREYVKQ